MSGAAAAAPVAVALDVEAGTAPADGMSLDARTPAALWQALGARFGDHFVHLLPATGRSDAAAVGEAAAEAAARGAEALVGRVRHADGQRSPRFTRHSALRYLDVAPGAVLCRASAAATAIAGLTTGWDRFWSRDLALRLAEHGPLQLSDAVLAELPAAPLPTPRLPVARATLADAPAPDAGLILVYGRLGASTSLYFDGLPPDLRARFRMLEPGDLFSDLPWLATATMVIVVRGFAFAEANSALDLLAELGTPILWFTDDDFAALGSEVAALGFYTPAALQRFCARLAGILTSSERLAGRLAAFHTDITVLPLVADHRLLARRPAAHAATGLAAVIGGSFRARSFRTHLVPAARQAGTPLAVTATMPGAPREALRLAFQQDFAQFVFAWQALAPRALLHPYGESGNIDNKSLGTLLCAAYLGAVPIVGAEAGHAALGEAEGVLVAGRDAEDWRRQLVRLADADARRTLLGRLDDWVRRDCDPEAARPVWARLLARRVAGDELAVAGRLAHALDSRALQRALPRQPAAVRQWRRLRASLERRIAGWFRPRG